MRIVRSLLLYGALMTAGGAAGAQPGPSPRPVRGTSPAAVLLTARGPLGLTDEQVARLERLAAAQSATLTGSPGDPLRARADLVDAMRGEGDAAALKRAMDRLHQLRTERALARLKARQEARAILTADQRAKADAMRGAMRANRGAMRRGGRGGRWGGRGRPGMAQPPAGGRRQGGAPLPPREEPAQP